MAATVVSLSMASGILRVEGDKVVGNDGKPIILRGAGLGGWMKCVSRHFESPLVFTFV